MKLTGGNFGPTFPTWRQASLIEWGFTFKNTTYTEWVWTKGDRQ